MSKRSLAIAAALATILLCPPHALPAQALERLFYYVDREDSYQSLVKNIDQITILGPQVYTVDSLGHILDIGRIQTSHADPPVLGHVDVEVRPQLGHLGLG